MRRIDDGLDHRRSIGSQCPGKLALELGSAFALQQRERRSSARAAPGTRPRTAPCRNARAERRSCFTLIRLNHRSSRTTNGIASFSRCAAASSPQVIWKQPSPTMQTTGKSGRASFAAIAAGSPKPIDDQPLVIRKVRGACAVHWLAIWCVCAPTSKASTPSRGRTRRTTSIASCGEKRGRRWTQRALERVALRLHRAFGPRAVDADESAASAATTRSRSPTTSCAIKTDESTSAASAIDVQHGNVSGPRFVFHFDRVVAEPDDEIGALVYETTLHLCGTRARCSPATADGPRRSGLSPSWSTRTGCGGVPRAPAVRQGAACASRSRR